MSDTKLPHSHSPFEMRIFVQFADTPAVQQLLRILHNRQDTQVFATLADYSQIETFARQHPTLTILSEADSFGEPFLQLFQKADGYVLSTADLNITMKLLELLKNLQQNE